MVSQVSLAPLKAKLVSPTAFEQDQRGPNVPSGWSSLTLTPGAGQPGPQDSVWESAATRLARRPVLEGQKTAVLPLFKWDVWSTHLEFSPVRPGEPDVPFEMDRTVVF